MTEGEVFQNLFEGGRHALPFLLKFSHSAAGVVRVVNNNVDIIYDGERYSAAAFKYSPPDNQGEGASLEIDGIETGLIDFVESADDAWRLDVVGVMADGDEIQKIRGFSHFFGSVSYGDDRKMSFSLGADDRLDMAFPPYMYDTATNKGNA